MPLTDLECPECNAVIHTDSLLEGHCPCGNVLLKEMYSDVINFYTPESKR